MSEFVRLLPILNQYEVSPVNQIWTVMPKAGGPAPTAARQAGSCWHLVCLDWRKSVAHEETDPTERRRAVPYSSGAIHFLE